MEQLSSLIESQLNVKMEAQRRWL